MESQVMKTPDMNLFDVELLAVAPLMAVQLFGLLMLVLAYAHP
jgi:hypothetical protein